MTFIVRGLDPAPFVPLFQATPEALARAGAHRVAVATRHAAPCRVRLDDLEPGATALLLSYEHQPAATPYRQRGPIFLGIDDEAVAAVYDNEIPPALARRPLSLRAFDSAGMMVDADLVDGVAAHSVAARMLGQANVAYLHAHYARRGCFAARVTRY